MSEVRCKPAGLKPLVAFLTCAVSVMSVQFPTRAGNGRVEINHARALKGGITAGDAAGYPVTIDETGSYVLTGSLAIPHQNTRGIEVTASHTTIDLNGFEIVGPTSCTGSGSAINCTPTGSGAGIYIQNARNVTVRNGTIRGAGASGIRTTGTVEATYITNVRVSHCGNHGISVGPAVVTGTHASTNQNDGMYVTSTQIIDSVVVGNGGSGIQLFDESLISRCMSLRNGSNGITAFETASIIDNTIVHNEGLGISCMHFIGGAPSTDASFSGNVIEANDGGTVNFCQPLGTNICDGDTLCP